MTNITPGPEPAAAPSARDTLSMEVESWVRQAGKVDKWIVQFIAPCLIQWKFSVPWVRLKILHPFSFAHAAAHARFLCPWGGPLVESPSWCGLSDLVHNMLCTIGDIFCRLTAFTEACCWAMHMGFDISTSTESSCSLGRRTSTLLGALTTSEVAETLRCKSSTPGSPCPGAVLTLSKDVVRRWGADVCLPCGLVQGNQNVLNLYMVPTAPGRCRTLVDMHTSAKGMPLLAYLALKYLKFPSWFVHLVTSNVILDGDTALLHWQVCHC